MVPSMTRSSRTMATSTSTATRRWWRSRVSMFRTTAICHPRTRRSSAPCRRSLERGFRTGGFAVPKDLTRADYRASWAKMVALLKKMHEAGIPIVAGTDGSGIEIVRELEIYQEAGFTPAEALAAATIVPARLVGQEQHTGSIKTGKAADLALVDGDPSTQIGAFAPDPRGHAGWQIARCRCAAESSRIFRPAEVVALNITRSPVPRLPGPKAAKALKLLGLGRISDTKNHIRYHNSEY